MSPTERYFPTFSLQRTFSTISSQYSKADVYFELLTVAEERSFLRLYYWALINYTDLLHEFARIKPVSEIPQLDSYQQIAMRRLKRGIGNLNHHYISKLINEKFPIEEVFQLYNTVVDDKIDKGNFHKLIKRKEIVEETGELVRNVDYRPPKLYRFKG